MIEEARARVPDAGFVVGDVTGAAAPPAHLVYARLLLGHLPDPASTLARWVVPMRVGGLVVCEEPVRYRSDDALFAALRSGGDRGRRRLGAATLWAGPALDDDPPGCRRVLDRIVEHPVTAARPRRDVLAQCEHVGWRAGPRRRAPRRRAVPVDRPRDVGDPSDGVGEGA